MRVGEVMRVFLSFTASEMRQHMKGLGKVPEAKLGRGASFGKKNEGRGSAA